MSWRAELIKHRGALRIAVYFDKNPEFIRRIQLLANARWNVTQQVWHLPDTDENRERFKLPPRFQANKNVPRENGSVCAMVDFETLFGEYHQNLS